MSNTVELLTAEQVAAAIGCNSRSILRWRKEGLIPAEIDRGNFLRFDLERVREALRKDAETKR